MTRPPIFESSNPHLSGLFAPVREEFTSERLVVRGELPRALVGLYLRNGQNPYFEPLVRYDYPFDGDGMVHGVWIAEGRAEYRNRFVRTPMLEAEIAAGRALWGGILSDVRPSDSEVGTATLANTNKHLPNVNVVQHHGSLLALSEMSPSYRLSPTLETLGPETYGGAFPSGTTAHPHVDPTTGEMVLFAYLPEPPFLIWAQVRSDGALDGPHVVPGVTRSYFTHDFVITERYAVFILTPGIIHVGADGAAPLSWQPELGTEILVVDRRAPDSVTRLSTDAFWVWHHANGFEDGDDLCVDAVVWSHLRLGAGPSPTCAFERLRISPTTGAVRRTRLDERAMEFPRIDERVRGRRHGRVAVTTRTGERPLPEGDFDAVTTLATDSGARSTFEARGRAVGEPCFVPASARAADDQGYYLTFVTDRATRASSLVVLPAEDVSQGPVAVIELPARVPLGLHGQWLSAV